MRRLRNFMRRIGAPLVGPGIRPGLTRRRRFETCQVTLEQQRGGHPIHRAFPFLPAHVGGNQKILRRLCRHPLVPEDERHRQRLLQPGGEFPHGLNRGSLPPVQLQRKPQHHPPNLMRLDEGDDVSEVTVKGAALECFQRLGRPPQLVTEGHADPLRAVIKSQYA